jgi:HK97 family phage major capsid protein
VQADLDIIGGYLVAPEQFVNQVLKAADNLLFIRKLATVFRVQNSSSLGVPSLDADPSDADWTSELATGTEDSTMAFGKRELVPRPVAKRLKVSRKMLNVSSIQGVMSANDLSEGGTGTGFERFVTGRLGYKFAVTGEKAFMTGNGSGQPLGLFTASNRGISTARDVASGSTAAITFDSLFDMLYSLKAMYQQTCQWLFSRAAMQRIRKLKDQQNRYLWEPSTQAGEPNRLLDRPIMMSEYVPNTFTSNAYVGLLGDFSYYWIADSVNMELRRLDELYAEANQVGYIGRMEFDGMPALEEAFARLQLS